MCVQTCLYIHAHVAIENGRGADIGLMKVMAFLRVSLLLHADMSKFFNLINISAINGT